MPFLPFYENFSNTISRTYFYELDFRAFNPEADYFQLLNKSTALIKVLQHKIYFAVLLGHCNKSTAIQIQLSGTIGVTKLLYNYGTSRRYHPNLRGQNYPQCI